MFVLGCGESAAPTADLYGPEPRFSFTNGPNTPNVFRFEDHVFDVIADFETGLIVFVGLPADVFDVSFCGGQSDFDLMPIGSPKIVCDDAKRLLARSARGRMEGPGASRDVDTSNAAAMILGLASIFSSIRAALVTSGEPVSRKRRGPVAFRLWLSPGVPLSRDWQP